MTEAPDSVICSAKGCTAVGVYAVVWNNPKIHDPDREKTWIACEEHRQYLSHFLDRRGFLRRVDRLGQGE
ncbi:hypothetical protein [Haloechinothrix sp. LS1_15]|uniref:hypothetical protein n=1 Tax=Haloechinothrix sp. LS1_15 TaxID=2652248 RepID=UPI00294601AC|nr:hypothetical protein [Haloechinothrix sp. LS1_15]MDV6010936.1 hypothetical protein [Haloechinothrix sp. LS1_15]